MPAMIPLQAKSEQGEGAEGEGCRDENAGGSRCARRKPGEALADGEADRGGENWGAAEAERLGAR